MKSKVFKENDEIAWVYTIKAIVHYHNGCISSLQYRFTVVRVTSSVNHG